MQAGLKSEDCERKRLVLLLRYVIIASAAYLVLAGQRPLPDPQLLYVAVFAASNLVLSYLPAGLFQLPHFGPILLLIDTGFILFGLSWTSAFSQDLLLVYFFTIFITTMGESLSSIALGGALTSGLYGYWLWQNSPQTLTPEMWLRLPFIFLVAIFSASLTERLKAERRQREMAEVESAHLRLLLDVSRVFSETDAIREFVDGIGRVVEQACPGIKCSMLQRSRSSGDSPDGYSFDLRSHAVSYGELLVQTPRGRKMSDRETWLCQMLAHAAAGALYAAEQSEAARTAAETKEQFLSTVSHELRTPLHAIIGYAEILDLNLPPEDSIVRENVDRLRANAFRLQNLIEQVLGFAEIRAGNRIAIAEETRLEILFQELESVAHDLLGKKPVTVLPHVQDGVESILTDRRMLRQALLCLISNAVKFTESGRIMLTAKCAGEDQVELSVSDTGIGIAEESVAVIFDTFKQADNSLTRRYQGLGLGLPIAHELVNLLGGMMQIESKVGVGTTAGIRIPRNLMNCRHDREPVAVKERAQCCLPQLSQAGAAGHR